MNERFQQELADDLALLREAGTLKEFLTLQTPQSSSVQIGDRGDVLVLSSNNYLGLANHASVVEAGIAALRTYGAGTASVRFICGTFAIHRELEAALASFVGTESALTSPSCWMANEGLFPLIAGPDSAIFSDVLNHASIIDACRLAKQARRFVYRHGDVAHLEEKIREAGDVSRKIVVTDGVFSMEGDLAPLPELVALCERVNAVLVVDDSHGTGVLGATGRGVAEHFGLIGRIDIITSTLGKALGGAAGGFVAGPEVLIQTLEQRSRTQLFSNALPPTVAGSAKEALAQLEKHPEWVEDLREKSHWFRTVLREAGFEPLDGESPIVPVILGETARAVRFSKELLQKGVFITGFGFPVVPEGTARLRIQLSVSHTRQQLEFAIQALREVAAQGC